MKTITALDKQTIWDLAIQEMGSVEGAFLILAENAFLRLDMSIPAGTKVLVPDTVLNADVVDYLSRNGYKPASGLGEDVDLTGIDMIDIIQIVNYKLAANNAFEGTRLWNLQGDLTVQLNFQGLSDTVHIYIEQSLDGINYTAIPNGSTVIDNPDTTVSLNLHDLLTNYCRVRVETPNQDGTLLEIIWRD